MTPDNANSDGLTITDFLAELAGIGRRHLVHEITSGPRTDCKHRDQVVDSSPAAVDVRCTLCGRRKSILRAATTVEMASDD